MNTRREATTQAEFDAILNAKDIAIVRTGCWVARGSSHVEAWGSSHVEAWESSHVEAWESSHVEAWESSHVEARGSSHVEARESSHVEARGSSHVEAWGYSHVEARESSHVVAWGYSHVEARESSHVVAWESSHVVAWESSHVEARGSSHVETRDSSHVEARESSHVVAWGSSHVEATKYVSCVIGYDHRGKVTGGVQIRPDYSTVEKWLEYHGVKVKHGQCVLYKAVRNDFTSSRGFLYKPGTEVAALDWDGDARECGGGLHLSACFEMAKSFDSEATKSLACTVAVKDLAIGPIPLTYPQKIKARRILKIEEQLR